MATTKIEWADRVWNPVTGCTKVSEGCRNCYAERIAKRFWGERPFSAVQCHADRLDAPLHWRKPHRVFVNSMSDLFHPDIPFSFIDLVFRAMSYCLDQTFMILTKRPERMQEFITGYKEHPIEKGFVQMLAKWNSIPLTLSEYWPLPNVWIGVTVEDQQAADERIPLLLHTPAAIRFVSVEPMLKPVDLALFGTIPHSSPYSLVRDKLNWVICGGETGGKARPMHPNWARSLRDQCQDANVPFFFKGWGQWLPVSLSGNGWGNIPANCEITQIGSTQFASVGKKRTGHLLDGREWNEFPEVE